jgi:hypothetical protein
MLGKGNRFFSDGSPPSGLALASTNAVSSGVLINTYTPVGPQRTCSLDDAVPLHHPAEPAYQTQPRRPYVLNMPGENWVPGAPAG